MKKRKKLKKGLASVIEISIMPPRWHGMAS